MGLHHAAVNHATTNITATRFISQVSNLEITQLNIRTLSDILPGISSSIFLGLAEEGIIFTPVFTNNTNGEKAIRFFMSATPDVSTTNYSATEKQYYSGKEGTVENSNFKISWFVSRGFEPGQTVYVRAYGDGRYADDYEDPISGLTVFPCLSAKGTQVVSFVVPGKK